MSVSPFGAGIRCRCPACGRGNLFRGFLTVVPECAVCGQDLGGHEEGDGPAVFAVLLLGAIVVGLALLAEVHFRPPLWLHAALWVPLTLGGAVALLRPLKATLIALQFRNRPEDYDAAE